MKTIIVTFSCQKTISVYKENSAVRPMSPYKVHAGVKAAKKYMKDQRGIKNAKVIEVS